MVRSHFRERYQSVDEVLNDLQNLRPDRIAQQTLVEPRTNRQQAIQPHKFMVPILLLGLSGLVGIGYWSFHSSSSVPTPTESSPSASPTPTESSSSENAEFFFNRGLDKYNRKDYAGAIADYNQAIRLNPNDAIAYNNRGLACSDLGDK